MGCANGHKPVLLPYSPVLPVGSLYRYPYGHIRRGQTYSGSYNGTMDFSQMDLNVIGEQLALQMQIYRQVMCLVGDVVAYRTQRRACNRAPVINQSRSSGNPGMRNLA
jgi:hypothetical protein